MKRLFEIQTLSDNITLNDPVTVITGAAGVLLQLFPNIFGGNRKRLTDSDWLQLLPGNGTLTTALRNYLKTRIHYDVDVYKMAGDKTSIQLYTEIFADENEDLWCPTKGCWKGSVSMPIFYSILQKEALTGGTQPYGSVPGFISGFNDVNLQTILLIGGGLLLLFALNKKKRK